MKALLLSLFSWVICILIPITSNAQLQDSLDWIYEKLPAQIFPTGLLHDVSSVHLFTANSFTGNTTGGHITGGDYLIERSLFHNNDVGLILSGPSKWIQIESCNFSSNSSAGLQSVQSKLHVLCSTFSYNTIGVKAFKGQLKLAKNAGNTFQNNTVGVSFQSLEKLELQQGHNTFSQQVMYDLAGSFAPTTTISYNGSYYYLFATTKRNRHTPLCSKHDVIQIAHTMIKINLPRPRR